MNKILLIFLFIMCLNFLNFHSQAANANEELKIIDFQMQQTNLPAEDDVQTKEEPQKDTEQESNIVPVNNINQLPEIPVNQDYNNVEDDFNNQMEPDETEQQN